MKHNEGFVKIATDAKQQIQETDVATVKQRLDRGEVFHLIDVRETEEWVQGHIPGATHLSKGVIERDIEKIVADKNAEIVLYCGGGYRSALACVNLQNMGYTNVISMDGGIRGWINAGYSIDQ